jgi:hypothetical protein
MKFCKSKQDSIDQLYRSIGVSIPGMYKLYEPVRFGKARQAIDSLRGEIDANNARLLTHIQDLFSILLIPCACGECMPLSDEQKTTLDREAAAKLKEHINGHCGSDCKVVYEKPADNKGLSVNERLSELGVEIVTIRGDLNPEDFKRSPIAASITLNGIRYVPEKKQVKKSNRKKK